MELERLNSQMIMPDEVIVFIEKETYMFVGRIIEESIQRYGFLEMLTRGLFAEFDILEAEQYRRAGDFIYSTYFASKIRPAEWPKPGVYRWPSDAPLTLTFNPKHPERWKRHIQMKVENFYPLITLE